MNKLIAIKREYSNAKEKLSNGPQIQGTSITKEETKQKKKEENDLNGELKEEDFHRRE